MRIHIYIYIYVHICTNMKEALGIVFSCYTLVNQAFILVGYRKDGGRANKYRFPATYLDTAEGLHFSAPRLLPALICIRSLLNG